MKIVERRKIICPRCLQDAFILSVESDLGHRFDAYERWCACPTDLLMSDEPHPKPSKCGPIELDVEMIDLVNRIKSVG